MAFSRGTSSDSGRGRLLQIGRGGFMSRELLLIVHLAMYCRKMVAYIYDDKILIHCFQDSLT
ncbi:hypothetical protein CR513_58886, partial [Mucuna pruriens]